MRRKVETSLLFVILICGLAGQANVKAADAAGAEESLVQFLPTGAIGTVEIADLAQVIARVETSDGLKAYLGSGLYEDALKAEPVRKGLAGKAVVEAQLGMSLWEIARIYFGDRVLLGVYPPSGDPQPDGVVVIRVKDSASLTKLIDKLSPLISLAGDQISMSDRDGGGKTLKFKDGHQAILKGQWIVVSKKNELVNQTLTNLSESRSSGLADQPAWKTMAGQIGCKHTIAVCVDTAKVSQMQGKRLIPEKLDNPVISLLYGGVLELAAHSPYLGLTLDMGENNVTLRTCVAGKASELDDAHRALLVDPAQPRVPLIPGIADRLGTISFSRGLVKWYKAREQLLEAKLLPEFDKFETGLATFLPGKDFAEDLLPLLTGRIALVSAPQDYSYLDGKPGVQLPAFALVFELTKPREGADILNLVGQTILTVRNLEAAKHKHHPWVQASESYHDVQINFARYLQRPKGEQLATLYNFQPATALAGNRFILSSSLGLCRQLIDALSGTAPVEAAAVDNDRSASALPNFIQEISPAIAAQLLQANAAVIHARNVQNGKTAEQSARELDALCQLLTHLTTIRFDTVQYAERVQLEVHAGWK